KVFTNIGYIWRPTSRFFTLLGNAFPLTRFTTIAKVPIRKPVALESNTPKPVVFQIVLWYLDSGCSKHMTGDRSQLTNFVNKFLGTVKFGLGHNLFSIRQFCDSDLEVAFRQHTYFIRNLEALKEQLNKLKGKAVIPEAVSLNYVDAELLKVDVATLAPKLCKNRTAHTDYIRHTQDEAATLR
nr:hypothetical protein [Tanacetum cinerariifolium]